MIIAFGFIIAIILIKYKPVYKISISGQEVGYLSNMDNIEEDIKTQIEESENKNVDSVIIEEEPECELKLVDRTLETNEEEVLDKIEENTTVTYKYYEIAVDDTVLEKVNTIDEAEEVVNEIKVDNEEKINQEGLVLNIKEQYTQNEEEADTNTLEVAKTSATERMADVIEEAQAKREEQERIDAMPDVNGIKLATIPVTGIITSRYGVSSRIRSSDHTGLDIAAKSGTDIQVVADGVVEFAAYNGSYGKLVKINHGNGVETWYAHTSKIYVKVGQEVKAGDVIAAVGSTGNSTGPHLHFEIRISERTVDPQKILEL